MTDTAPQTDASRRIRDEAERIARELPILRPLLDSFAPLIACRAALRAAAPGWVGPLPRVDEDAFCAGSFLLADLGFQEAAPHLPEAAARLLPLMEQAFPALAPGLVLLRQGIANGSIPSRALEDAAYGQPVAALALAPGLSPELLAFAARELVRPHLERQAESLAPLFKDLPWRRPHCPTCGGEPGFTRMLRVQDEADYISGHGGIRFLRCATCATEWRYKRISCPRCGNEEPKAHTMLHAAGRPHERLDVCEACRTYCLCQDASEFISLPDPDLSALAMLPLELRARQDGYAPFTLQPWNMSLESVAG